MVLKSATFGKIKQLPAAAIVFDAASGAGRAPMLAQYRLLYRGVVEVMRVQLGDSHLALADVRGRRLATGCR
jgi:hypothetical protein